MFKKLTTTILLLLMSVTSAQEICEDFDTCGCPDEEMCTVVSIAAGQGELWPYTHRNNVKRGCFVNGSGDVYYSIPNLPITTPGCQDTGCDSFADPSWKWISCPTLTPTLTPTREPSTSPPTSSPSSSPTFVEPIDTNQVLPVGTGEVGSPYGTVTLTPGTIGGLVIETYFEASQSQFDNNAISIEVYSGVEEDEEDCTQGNLVNKYDVDGNTVYTSKTDLYDSNTGTVQLNGATSDGVVGIARVTFTDFTAPLTDLTATAIWFPVDKQVKLCVVTSIKMDYNDTAIGDGTDGGVVTDKEYTVNHMDSKRTISIDLTADIGPQAVDITQSIATNSDMDAVLEIPVDSFLCNNKYEEVTNRLYTVGRTFRVCVGPPATGYIVDNYIELTCGDRSLITTDATGATTIDALTVIDSDFNTAGVLVLRSVITAEDVVVALATETDGKVQFTCTGKVSLSYTAPIRGRALRDLQTSTEVAVPSGAGGGAEELLEGLFELNIEMDIPSNESSAPLSSSMTTTVAVIGFGSILSVVSSMMW